MNAEFPSAVKLYKIVLLTSVLLSDNLHRVPGLGKRIEMGEEARQIAIGICDKFSLINILPSATLPPYFPTRYQPIISFTATIIRKEAHDWKSRFPSELSS